MAGLQELSHRSCDTQSGDCHGKDRPQSMICFSRHGTILALDFMRQNLKGRGENQGDAMKHLREITAGSGTEKTGIWLQRFQSKSKK
jgi:hypothetical protein